MKNSPLISIIMPTYNSESTIDIVLDSIRNQSYSNYEVLVIDGGSTDNTIKIAKEYGCEIISNPKKLPEYAKHIGLVKAKGSFAVTLDSDEVPLSKDFLYNRVVALEKNPDCKNISSSGLINPKNYPEINNYIISYGEPFSWYMYGINGSDYLPDMYKRFKIVNKTERAVIFGFSKNDIPPICDGGGHFFDLDYLKSIVDMNDMSIASQIFSVMVGHTHELGFIMDDFIEHYSTPSIKGFLNKLRWRIINNVHYATTKTVGYSNRETSYPWRFKIKKMLFPLYVISFIGPLYHGLRMVFKNKSLFYFIHIYFSYYTLICICKEMIKKLLGFKSIIGTYGK